MQSGIQQEWAFISAALTIPRCVSYASSSCLSTFFFVDQTLSIICVQVSYDSLGNFPTAKTRVTLYSHVNRFGAAWKVHSLKGDGTSPFLLSVSSDGSVRGGFAPNLVMPKIGTTPEVLIELFRVLDVTTVRENGGSGGSESAGMVLVSGGTDVFTPENYCVETFSEKNSVALHAIDSTLLYEASRDVIFKCGAQHLVAFGGAAGIVKVQTFNPLKQVLERSTR